ncbi:biopolymer transporter ExbD [Lacihabitans sp. LS3-19]|uniref:biopolymer transporter ExbD n=1 Tax=Lacihabitans sp. LS3-19 TaxID=2487335 RepID=UPI0020CDF4C7|nr:biopolymer transporter ExbD [Lacihabitans sp. LS3-19]MCP9767376.1 biopolymer transporter ExbD [Lacihabitans sp. LS3-19]
MAEIEEKKEEKKRRLGSTSKKPDMTPMVDLGFLLITFFMFTTSFTKPHIMKLFMPEKNGPTGDVGIQNSMTILLGKNNEVYWYQKELKDLKANDLIKTDFSAHGIREIILNKRELAPKPEIFTVIIKPSNDSNLKNTVDLLDEMEITQNPRYALVDLFPSEKLAYENTKKAQIMKNK